MMGQLLKNFEGEIKMNDCGGLVDKSNGVGDFWIKA